MIFIIPEWLGTMTGLLALMWSPAIVSVFARLVLRESFSDVSFRFGGLRTLPWYALGVIVPIVVETIAYGAAWLTGLVGFDGSAAICSRASSTQGCRVPCWRAV